MKNILFLSLSISSLIISFCVAYFSFLFLPTLVNQKNIPISFEQKRAQAATECAEKFVSVQNPTLLSAYMQTCLKSKGF